MMLELQRPFPVDTPLGYGWAIIVSRESNLANDIWTVVMERDGAFVHFRSEQIWALPNGTLDINTQPNTCKSNTTTPTAEQPSAEKRKAKTRQRGAGR
jgi:hypothetical protein